MKFEMRNTILFMMICLSAVRGQTPTGGTLIDYMTAIMSPENSKALISQQVIKADGRTRTFEFEMYSAGKGEKVLMRYVRPSSVRGQTFLLLNDGDDIWTYFPRTRRVRKLASHAKKQKVQGSDFSFGDFSSEETWKEDYTTENIGSETVDGFNCWRLKAVAKADVDADFPEVILFVRKDNYYPIQIDYLDEKGRMGKSLYLTNIQNVDGYPTARLFTMENHLEGSKTIMKMTEISYNWNPPDGFFSQRNLKK